MQLITIIGNLGRDADHKTLPSGAELVSFSVAVSYGKDKTFWYDCTIWEKWMRVFEGIIPYLTKGTRLCITAEVTNIRTYVGKDGTPKTGIGLEPRSMKFVGGKKEEEQPPASAPPLPPGTYEPTPVQGGGSYVNQQFEDIPF